MISKLAPGLYPDIPAETYHVKELGVVSKGCLEHVDKSLLNYYAWATGQIDESEKPAFAFGRACHMAILEPAIFDKTYVIAPEFGPQRKTDDCSSEQAKENKLRKQAWMKGHAGATILDSASGIATFGMINSIRQHRMARNALCGGDPELTIRWNDPETGLPCKSRSDYYIPHKATVVDVKSTTDASEEAFQRDAYRYHYGWQSVLYRLGFAAIGAPVQHFIFIAVEKTPPYDIAIYDLDANWVARSYDKVRELMGKMNEAVRTERWPGYPLTIKTLSLPRYAA